MFNSRNKLGFWIQNFWFGSSSWWVNDDRILIFGWMSTFKYFICYMQDSSRSQGQSDWAALNKTIVLIRSLEHNHWQNRAVSPGQSLRLSVSQSLWCAVKTACRWTLGCINCNVCVCAGMQETNSLRAMNWPDSGELLWNNNQPEWRNQVCISDWGASGSHTLAL